MEKEMKGRFALNTGATSRIGRATVLRFAEAGARVAAVGRNEEALRSVVDETAAAGGYALAVRADVTAESDMRRALSKAVEKFGALDVLVNAAGHLSNGTIENTTLEAWDAMMQVNLHHRVQIGRAHV